MPRVLLLVAAAACAFAAPDPITGAKPKREPRKVDPAAARGGPRKIDLTDVPKPGARPDKFKGPRPMEIMSELGISACVHISAGKSCETFQAGEKAAHMIDDHAKKLQAPGAGQGKEAGEESGRAARGRE